MGQRDVRKSNSELQGGHTPPDAQKLTPEEKAKERRLMEIYKQTLAEHNAKRAAQKNACAICRRSFTQFQAYQDHDHACCPRRLKKFCGKCNRDLLCFLCNKKAVGMVEYWAKLGIPADKVLAYLAKWKPIIEERGGYAPKEKAKKLRAKQKSV